MGAAAEADSEDTGVSPELLDRLRPYLAESLMVLDADWTVVANLAPPGGLIGRGLGLGLHTLEDMHPDDAVQVLELGVEAFSTQPGWQGSKVVRMLTGNDTYGQYEITAINCFDDPVISGMVVRTCEVLKDPEDDLTGISPATAIETLAELLPVGVLLLDHRGTIVFANETACGLLGREPEDLKREGLTRSIDDADRQLLSDVLRRVSTDPGQEGCALRLVGGRAERVECRFTSEGAGDVTSVVVTMEDVTQRYAERRALERRANEDPLTGLHNRGALHDILQGRLDRKVPTTVAFIDLDGFKSVNDSHGHARGDQLLVAVAEALCAYLGDHREVARIGGDEFVVVASDVEVEDDESFGHRLRGIVASVARAEGLPVTGSVGICHAAPGDTPRDLLCRADDAMYEVKGRRREALSGRTT